MKTQGFQLNLRAKKLSLRPINGFSPMVKIKREFGENPKLFPQL
jgi:hypothetical protein